MTSRIALVSLFAAVYGQQVGTYQTETHPSLTWQSCTAKGSCTTNTGSIVLDGNWRWTHGVGTSTNCYTGNTWDATLCPDDATCAQNCALEGADYSGTYGITTSGNSLRLNFVTQSANKNIGSRVYLMADTTHYKTFNLLNQEFTFDVDVSNLPCGLNGAVYFANLPADGGISSTNTAGAEYGTGYCDSQCPRDMKFIKGQVSSYTYCKRIKLTEFCTRPMLMAGYPQATTPTLVLVITVHAVLKWISGKQTQFPLLSLLTLVIL